MLAFSMSRLSVKWLEELASPLAFGVEALAIHNTGSNRACQSYSEIFMHKYTGKIEIVQNSYVVTPKLQKKKKRRQFGRGTKYHSLGHFKWTCKILGLAELVDHISKIDGK